MSPEGDLYSATQASALTGLDLKAVHNAIDKHIVKTVGRPATEGARASRRMLTWTGLVCLCVWDSAGAILTADRRRHLFDEIAADPRIAVIKINDVVTLNVAAARRQLVARLRVLRAAEAAIHKDRHVLGGEPVFRGTRIPVHGIAAMLAAGADRDELLDGYPKLDSRKLDLAAIWTTAYPRRGRPRSLADQGLIPKSSKRVPLEPAPPARAPEMVAADSV